MHNNRLLAPRLIAFALVFVAFASWSPLLAQGRPPAAASSIPRTADGRPDLQGFFDVATITPIERPQEFADLILSNEQARRLERGEQSRTDQRALPSPVDRAAPPVGGNVGGYNSFWIDRGTQVITIDGKQRSSLIIDPPDGRIPPLTAEARSRSAARAGQASPDAAETGTSNARAFENPEERPLGERCLLGFGSTSGPPTLPNYFYNNLKQIVQTPTTIMILNEMVHDARIIRIGGEHLPSHIRKWMGDSVGRWEGDTLVVDTTNFTSKTRFRGSSENLHVVERFTRVDADNLLYKFTIDDPTTWTRPWTGEYPWPKTDANMYEYACHEGNYALENILRGARQADRQGTKSEKP